MNWAPGDGCRKGREIWQPQVCSPFRLKKVEPDISETEARRKVCLKHALSPFTGLYSLIFGNVWKVFGLSCDDGKNQVLLWLGLFYPRVPWSFAGSEMSALCCGPTALAEVSCSKQGCGGFAWVTLGILWLNAISHKNTGKPQLNPSWVIWWMDTPKLCEYSFQVDFCFGPKDNLDLMLHMTRSYCRILAGGYMIWFIFRTKVE